MQHLKRMKHIVATCAHLLPAPPQRTLVDAELDAGTELEVAQVDRQMDRSHGGRREAQGHGAQGTSVSVGGVRREARARFHSARREMRGAWHEAWAHRAGAGGSVPRIKDEYAEGIIVHR
jgi:hypothetical protein